ncbi:cation diffusion facilitator family transporter [Litorimonas sp.]|jgi:cation diffusion facilitator family transporter|uniref:cation diffusion facilitator family transporter n=1 Tax=Litorimonas sp. TaxID=1892381 RepID=UPI003A837D13
MSAEPPNLQTVEDTRFDRPDRRGRPGRLPPENASRITRRITALAVGVGVILMIGKVLLWQNTHSVGVLSSLVHSGLDMFGALSSFVAVRYAARKPDGRYRFGRGKAEGFSAVFQVCLIVFAAFHLLEEVIHRIEADEALTHSGVAIAVMFLFVIITGWLLIAQSWAIRATGSIAVRGDRAHYLADLFANLFVIFGLAISAFTPFIWADAAVGLFMALWLLYTAYRVASLAWAQLMDMELNEDERSLIIRLAMADPRVRAVTELRTRASGPHIHIQMRLDMDETLSLSEAHDIIINAEKRLMADFQAADILIHPHPAGCGHSHGNRRFFSDTESAKS